MAFEHIDKKFSPGTALTAAVATGQKLPGIGAGGGVRVPVGEPAAISFAGKRSCLELAIRA